MLFWSGLKFGTRFSKSICEVGFILFASIRIPYNAALFSLFKENIWCFLSNDDPGLQDIFSVTLINIFNVISKNLFPRFMESTSDWAMKKFSFSVKSNSVLSPSHF